jgi:hypothetical protein
MSCGGWASHCREVAVHPVDFLPTAAAAAAAVQGRRLYRDTHYLALIRGDEAAVLEVAPAAADGELFRRVAQVKVLACAPECHFVRDPAVDVLSASALHAAAAAHGAPLVLEGSFGHVNFVLADARRKVTVLDVIPPEPKLLAQAQAALDALPLPPLRLVPRYIDLEAMARELPGEEVVFPCRAAGIRLDRPVRFLDQAPRLGRKAALVGCDRSAEIFAALYGYEPSRGDFCPRRRLGQERGNGLLLTKCCRLRGEVEHGPGWALVPWGASLEQVGQALTRLVQQAPE